MDADDLSSDEESFISNIPAPGAEQKLIQKFCKGKFAEFKKVQEKEKAKEQ